jgi:hypothetical protein
VNHGLGPRSWCLDIAQLVASFFRYSSVRVLNFPFICDRISCVVGSFPRLPLDGAVLPVSASSSAIVLPQIPTWKKGRSSGRRTIVERSHVQLLAHAYFFSKNRRVSVIKTADKHTLQIKKTCSILN